MVSCVALGVVGVGIDMSVGCMERVQNIVVVVDSIDVDWVFVPRMSSVVVAEELRTKCWVYVHLCCMAEAVELVPARAAGRDLGMEAYGRVEDCCGS